MAYSKSTIVVADDEENIVSAIKEILSDTYNVLTAPDGKQALKLVREALPRVVLLDIMMPGMDGMEVTKQLKADPKTKNIPIMFLTAKAQTQDVDKGFKAGAAAYVLKPFSAEKLLKKIEEVILKDDINRSV